MPISAEHRALFSRLAAAELPGDLCAECHPAIDGKTIEHEPMCPVMISIDDATENDRIWFDEHPYADHYYRPIAWGEAAELALRATDPPKPSTTPRLVPVVRVRVERVKDGIRLRRFDDVSFAATPNSE